MRGEKRESGGKKNKGIKEGGRERKEGRKKEDN